MTALSNVLVRFVLILAVLGGPIAGLSYWFSFGAPSAVLADDDDDDSEDEDEKDDEHEARGQVLVTYPDMDPPQFVIANVDGNMTVKVIKKEKFAESGVKAGDHVSVDGEKIHEQLFEATDIEITRRCCPQPGDNED